MNIDFDNDRWDKVKTTYGQWWRGELNRPVVPVTLRDRDPGRARPEAPLLTQATCTDLSISADALINRIDWELSHYSFFGDAYPYFNMDCFGPGILGAFLGAHLDNSTGRVWFHPPGEMEIADIHFRFDPDNVWFRRICDIYAAGMKRWQGQVLMGMTDLGGILDILSTFRPSEGLLLDLYDYPEEVRRLVGEAHEAWHAAYRAFNEVLQPANPGYSDWSGIYSPEPSYMLQCDFCYMIGSEMFDEQVKPEMEATCAKIPHAFYHLDGVGQLQHLDTFLGMADLQGVQWVPGSGKPDCRHWPEVYQKIRGAGKLVQLYGSFDVLEAVTGQLGSGRGLQLRDAEGPDQASILALLEACGVE